MAGDEGAFGARLGGYFKLADAPPSLRTTSFKSHQLAATRLRSLAASTEVDIPAEDGFLCQLQLSAEQQGQQRWRCDGLRLNQLFAKDAIGLFDLRAELHAELSGPLDTLSFHLPRAMLDEFADDIGATRIDLLRCEPGLIDPVLAHLGAALLPELHQPTEASSLFFDQLALAINAHLMQRYGAMRSLRRAPGGALSPTRERRAKDLLASRLNADVSIAEIASACGLSRAYFVSAFRQSTGMTPHKWLQGYKIERVKGLLARSDMTIAEMAAACGFADQSHLTRAFTKALGLAPAAWRRQCC